MVAPKAWLYNRIKATAYGYLETTCTIKRKQHVTEESGARQETLVIVATDVPCRMIRIGARYDEKMDDVQGQQALGDNLRISIKSDVTIDVDYVIVLEGTDWHVIRLEEPLTNDVWHTAVVGRLRRG
jgi:hypothetical protein